jgi:dimethylhistidine N-methyltransferase
MIAKTSNISFRNQESLWEKSHGLSNAMPISGISENSCMQMYFHNHEAIRGELSAGLLAEVPFTSPKYLYNALGSKLFEAICELPEYYPTRTEADIFNRYLPDIVKAVGKSSTLIDLGAGNCAKAARLFENMQPRQYVAVDISAEFLRNAVTSLQQCFPHIEMFALGMDFSESLDLPDEVLECKRLFFYPGSSIGNFTPEQAVGFLKRLRDACVSNEQDGLLIGVDLIKDKQVLDAAYDDALGVTASFNLNLLHHLNEILHADFAVRDWRHRAFFNAEKSRVEMHLEARRNATVTWHGGSRLFQEGERIHTESSYKYTKESFHTILKQAGFALQQCWTDPKKWFMVCHAIAA